MNMSFLLACDPLIHESFNMKYKIHVSMLQNPIQLTV